MRSFDGSDARSFPRPSSAPSPSHLDAPAATGRATLTALAELRPPVRTVGDLLEHVPFRHDDYRSASRLIDMKPGEEATVIVTIDRVRMRPTRRRNLVIVEAVVHDESGTGVVVWFNQRYLAKNLKAEMRLSVRGERRSTIDAEIVAKSHELVGDDAETLHTQGLVPVYPASETVSSRRLRTLVAEQLHHAGDRPDAVPAALLSARNLPLRRDALVACHQPRTMVEHAWGRRRLAYDELLLLQRGLVRHRRAVEQRVRAPALELGGDLIDRLSGGAAVRAHRRAAACNSRDRLGSATDDSRCAGYSRAMSGRARPRWRCMRFCEPSMRGARVR